MASEPTMLSRMEDARIFAVVRDGAMIRFTEACDYYYEYTLTRGEALRLAAELKAMAEEIPAMEGGA